MIDKLIHSSMNVTEKIQKMFKGNKPIKVNADSCYINTEVLYNSKYNFIVLVSFTKEYFSDMIEFLAACGSSRYYGKFDEPFLNIKYVHSSYEEDTGKKDEDSKPIIIIHEKNYLLLGGSDVDYELIYNVIDNLSNAILMAITEEIYAYRCSAKYKRLSKSFVLDSNKFKYKNIEPKYDDTIFTSSGKRAYDDAALIMSKLPKGFTGQNLLKFIFTYDVSYNNQNKTSIEYSLHSAFDYLRGYYIDKIPKYEKHIREFKDMYEALIKNGSDEVYENFVGPQYLVIDDEAIPGSISDENLDEIFREKYEKFTGIYDDSVEYTDIDEIVEDEEQKPRTKKFDKMVEIPEEDNE